MEDTCEEWVKLLWNVKVEKKQHLIHDLAQCMLLSICITNDKIIIIIDLGLFNLYPWKFIHSSWLHNFLIGKFSLGK